MRSVCYLGEVNQEDKVSSSVQMSNWSELPHDLLVEIAQRVKRLEDFVVFGAVCKGWCKAGKRGHFKGLWLRPTTPYLMLPVRDENDDVREFYSLIEGEIVASIRIPKFKRRKCHESLGWLLAVEEDGSMCLLDPFSSVEIPLPHQRTIPEFNLGSMDAYIFVRKMLLSARPSKTSDFIVMIIFGGCGHLAFWRPGDESWNIIELVERAGANWDVIYHGGHFYAIAGTSFVWVFTIEEHNRPKGRIVTRLVEAANNRVNNPVNYELIQDNIFYILKTSRSLFMIARTAHLWSKKENRFYYKTRKFKVYEVDMSTGTWIEINNVGSMAIFIGHNGTFAVDTSIFFGKIKGNHIYFSDDGWECYHFEEEKGGGKDMDAYNLETGTIESFYSGEVLLSKVSISIWINTPSF